MGTLKLSSLLLNEEKLVPRKLDPNDPEIKAIIDSAIRGQEAILKLKYVDIKKMKETYINI